MLRLVYSATRQTDVMFRVRWICLSFLILSSVSCEFLRQSNFTDVGLMNEVISCVERIADEFFRSEEDVLIISGDSFITEEMLRRLQPQFGINLANKKSKIDFSAICNIIVLADEGMGDPYEAVGNMTTNPRGRYVVVTSGKLEALETAALRFWRAGIPDVIFARPSNDGSLIVFGYEISSDYPVSTRVYVLDSCRGGKFRNRSKLFSTKFRDMKKHPLIVSVTNSIGMQPEIYVIRDGEELKINGVGSTLLNVFAEKLNFRLVVKEHLIYGVKQDNGTWTGPPGELMSGEADLTFSGIMPTEVAVQDLELSDFYRWNSLHFTMKIGGRTVSWKSVFKPLSIAVWISYLLVLLATLCLVCIVKKSWSLNIIKEYIRYIDIIKVLIGQGVRYPTSTGIRLAFALWLIYGYLTTTSYTGSLVRYLLIPNYQNNPNTFEELAESDIAVSGHHAGKLILSVADDPILQKIHDKFVIITNRDLRAIFAEKGMASMMSRTFILLHNWNSRLNESMLLHIVEAPVIGIPMFYFMKKGHPYREPLNQFIRRIHCSGLINKWVTDYTARKIERSNEQELVILTLNHLAGVFLILICGYVISTARFLYELYYV